MTDTVYVGGNHSDVVHLDRECKHLRQAETVRPADREYYAHRRVCRECDPDVEIDTTVRASGTCVGCGAELNDNGGCDWCATFEAVASLD